LNEEGATTPTVCGQKNRLNYRDIGRGEVRGDMKVKKGSYALEKKNRRNKRIRTTKKIHRKLRRRVENLIKKTPGPFWKKDVGQPKRERSQKNKKTE